MAKLYSIDSWKLGKKIIAKGNIKGTGKSQEQAKVVNEVMTTVTTTVDLMPVDEYRDMIDPLLDIFRKRRGRR